LLLTVLLTTVFNIGFDIRFLGAFLRLSCVDLKCQGWKLTGQIRD